MEVQKVIITDIQQKEEKIINYEIEVGDRAMYDYNYKGKLTFIKFKDILPINPKDDLSMVEMGYRSLPIMKNQRVFIKTSNEKERLKRLKSNIKSFIKEPKRLNSEKATIELAKAFKAHENDTRGLINHISNF